MLKAEKNKESDFCLDQSRSLYKKYKKALNKESKVFATDAEDSKSKKSIVVNRKYI